MHSKKIFSFSFFIAEITISENNVQSLLSAANLLMMQSVRDACSSYFERFLDETNAIGINCFAELHGTQELTKKAKRFILKKFSQVRKKKKYFLFCFLMKKIFFRSFIKTNGCRSPVRKLSNLFVSFSLFDLKINRIFNR